MDRNFCCIIHCFDSASLSIHIHVHISSLVCSQFSPFDHRKNIVRVMPCALFMIIPSGCILSVRLP